MDLKVETNERLNQNRITKHFKPNEYVFVLDRFQVPGSSRPLKTKFQPSPYVVVKSYPTTTLVKRISDGYQTSYSNNDLKVYNKTSPLFKDLPTEVSKVLLHDFQELLTSDFCTIAKYDNFEIRNAIELFDPVDHDEINKITVEEGSVNLFEEKSHSLIENPKLTAEFVKSQVQRINQTIQSHPTVPVIPDSTKLTTTGLVTEDPELPSPVDLSAPKDFTPNSHTINTSPLLKTKLQDTVQFDNFDKLEIDSASSDEDHVPEITKPASTLDETARSINLRSGTKTFPSRQKRVRFKLNPPRN
jgi:hypothetical protein